MKHIAKEPFKGHAQDHQRIFFLWERTSLEPKWPDVRSVFPAASLSNQPVEPAPVIKVSSSVYCSGCMRKEKWKKTVKIKSK